MICKSISACLNGRIPTDTAVWLLVLAAIWETRHNPQGVATALLVAAEALNETRKREK